MAMDAKALGREILNRSALCQSLYRLVIGATVGGLPWIDSSSGAAFGMAKDSPRVTSQRCEACPRQPPSPSAPPANQSQAQQHCASHRFWNLAPPPRMLRAPPTLENSRRISARSTGIVTQQVGLGVFPILQFGPPLRSSDLVQPERSP